MILLAIKGGCSSVVERMLCMYEAPGSIPGISIAMFFVAFFIGKKRFLVEWSLGGKKSLRKCFLFFFNRLQWRNRLAHGTYRQYKRYAGVVSSSLTWSNNTFENLCVIGKIFLTAVGFEPTPFRTGA